MSTISLNIYEEHNKSKIEKVYTADGYELMLGTVEDILAVVDTDNLNNDVAIAKTVLKIYPQLKPFLKDVFPGLTDEELKRIKVTDLIVTFKQIINAIMESLTVLKTGKN